MSDDSPAARLAAVVDKLQRNPWLQVSGHAGSLKVLVDYLGEQQRRLAECEARLAVLEQTRGQLIGYVP